MQPDTISPLLRELEETRQKYWNIDPEAAQVLEALIHTAKPASILEVGTSNGYSAIRMARVASQYGGHVHTIEFFQERIDEAQRNIERAGLSKNITIHKGDAVEVLPQLEQSGSKFQFVFLDGNKEEHATYFSSAMRMCPAGGIIVADNTVSHKEKLSAFFDAVDAEPRASALHLSIGTGLLVITVS